ncbi:MAG TPA: 3'-5' exonuclease [Bacteroidales bacterium]|nr:3'-5' exonuclease [Bacteroidales bacterium]
MNLPLKKPIIFFDLETTGTDIVRDKIVEITILRIDINQQENLHTYLINPERPIPPAVTKIHHITDEMVKDKPTFKELAHTIYQHFEGADIAGFNALKFDIPLLAEEFLRCNIDFSMKNRNIIDVQVIFHKMEQRNLSAAYKFYCKKDLENAHSSEADTVATYEILKAQLDFYPQLPNTIKELSQFSAHHRHADLYGHIIYNDKNEEVFNFGKYKGQLVADVLKKDSGYYGWLQNADFPLYTKKIITEIFLRENQK